MRTYRISLNGIRLNIEVKRHKKLGYICQLVRGQTLTESVMAMASIAAMGDEIMDALECFRLEAAYHQIEFAYL